MSSVPVEAPVDAPAGVEVAGRPWRGLSPDERRAARRERLLEAGLELFGTVGYAATSLTALCQAGGVSPRHFYDLLPGREQLLAELYDGLVATCLQEVAEAEAEAPMTVDGQLGAGLRAAVASLTDDPRRARVVLVEIVGVSPALDAHRRRVIAGFAASIEQTHVRLVDAGVLLPRDVRMLSIGLVGAINELLTDWLLSHPRRDVADVVPVLEQLLTAVFEIGKPACQP